MKYIFFLLFFGYAAHAFAMPPTDSLRTTIRANGFATSTVNTCNDVQGIALIGTIETIMGGTFNGFFGWETLGTGNFADADTLITVYTPSNADLLAGSVRLVLKPDCVCPNASDTVNIVFFVPVVLSNIATTNVTTCGATNGSISLTVLSGVSPFAVSYNKIGGAIVTVSLAANAANTLTINGLADGNYRINSITDARGCLASGAGIGVTQGIDKPNSPLLGTGGVVSASATSCSTCNGKLTINITGGTAPFSVQFDSAGIVRTRTGLGFDANRALLLTGFCSTSLRSIRITDVNNCAMPVLAGPFVIGEPQHPLVGIDGVQTQNASSCNSNTCDGQLQVRIATTQTGSAPYILRFDSAGVPKIRTNLPLSTANQVLVSSLCANVYGNIRLSDANGCALITTAPLIGPFVISQPIPPRIDTALVMNFCNSATGNIKILLNTMQLGTSPYRIVLSYNVSDSLVYNNVATLANAIDIGSIPPNLYTKIRITDSRGCFYIYTKNIRIFAPLTANITKTGCQPSALLNANAIGNGSFLYRWNTNATTQTLSNQNAGIYTVTITDVATACTLSISAALNPCSSVINTTLLLNDSIQICLPIGDLPQPAFSLSTCQIPAEGSVRSVSNSCFKYVASSSFVGTTQFCILQCNAATQLCDTTFVNVTIYYAIPGTETVLDTIGLGTIFSFCPPTNQLNAPPFITTQIYTNTTPNITFQLVNNCLLYTGTSIGTDTACVVICDILGACDTTMLYVSCYPSPRPNDDMITLPVQTLTVIDILQNDNLYTLPPTSVRLLNGTQDGTLTVTSDFKISFKSSAGICRNILPLFCEVCTAAGCDTNTLYIKVYCEAEKPLTIYTFMSPNGDGRNDEFRIDGLQKYPNAQISIYDRWGSLVFTQTDYKSDWQGTMNNIMLPDGTYFYVLELKNDDNTIKKGYLQMVR